MRIMAYGGPIPAGVLLVEDQVLIGIDLRDEFEARGFRVVGPVPRLADALAAVEATPVEAAVLDVRLMDGSGFEVARALRRGVPFVFYSGHAGLRDAYRTEFAA